MGRTGSRKLVGIIMPYPVGSLVVAVYEMVRYLSHFLNHLNSSQDLA